MVALLADVSLVGGMGGLATLVGTGAAASAPWIIHLLNKRRYRVIEWAAMEYLLESQRRNRRRIQMEQLILLAIRTLLILLLALALARPFASAVAGSLMGPIETDRVVLMDDSFSSQRQVGGETVFDDIRRGAAQIAGLSKLGQTYALVQMSDPGSLDVERFLPPTQVRDADAFIKEHLLTRQASDGSGQLARLLARARKVAAEGRNLNKEIYLLTGLQETDWRDRATQARRDDVAAELAEIRKAGYRLTLVDMNPYGEKGDRPIQANNLAVEDLAAVDRNVLTGRVARFRVTLRNFGATDVEKVSLTPQIDGLKRPVIQMKVLAGATASETFEYAFEQPGSHRVSMQADPDVLPLDNVRNLAVAVRPSINVLIVDGDPKIDRSRTESMFLELALNPDALLPAAERKIKGILPKVVTYSQFAQEDLSDFDAVVLANVGYLGNSTDLPGENKVVARLEQFVRGGGGLLVFLGEKVDQPWYADHLWKRGGGLLPAELEAPAGVVDDWEQARYLEVVSGTHPIFRGSGDAGGRKPLGTVPVFRHFPARPATLGRVLDTPPGEAGGEPGKTQLTAASVLVLLTDDSGAGSDPAMIEQGFGAGRVILVTTTCDADWTLWPKYPSFLIAAQQMVGYVGSSARGEQNVTVGRPFSACIPPKFYGGTSMYRTPAFPAEPEETLKVRAEGDQIWVFSPPARRAGFATLTLSKGEDQVETMALAANPDCPLESDLSPVGEADLRALYKDELAGVSIVRGGEALAGVVQIEAKTEIWVPLVVIVVGFMLVETFCAWKFAHHVK
jgi:hypothetical protein